MTLRSRSGYALTAFVCSLPFSLWLAWVLLGNTTNAMTTEMGSGKDWFDMILGGSVVPAVAAACVWSRGQRSRRGIILKGLAVVLITMLVGPFFPLIADAGMDSGASNSNAEQLWQFVSVWVVCMFCGNVFTLGLPWLVGMGVSLLFADRPTASA